MNKARILIVDDDEDVRTQLKWALNGDFEVLLAHDAPSATQAFKKFHPPVALVDLGLPPQPADPSEGLALTSEFLAYDRLAKVIVITGQSERQVALQAVGNGAYDFISKPVQVDELKIILRRALQMAALEREYLEQAKRLRIDGFEGMLGSSQAMQEVFATLRKVATTEAPVLILGESGTGKEMAALAVHQRSARKDGPFVEINCGAVPEDLLESELFGHEKGAFSGAQVRRKGRIEAANGGTLFLDEIGQLSPRLQARLLRCLEDGTVERKGGRDVVETDTRFVVAATMELHKAIEAGAFRKDLFYRLAMVVVQLPPLRERRDDVMLLAQAFLKRFAWENGKTVPPRFTRPALAALVRHSWPGNVRELENCIRRAVIVSDGRYVTERDLGLNEPAQTAPPQRLRDARDALERDLVRRALSLHAGNISAAAEELGISRPTLYELIERLGIPRSGEESHPGE